MIHKRLDININRYFDISKNIRRGRSEHYNHNIISKRYNSVKGQMHYTNRVLNTWSPLPVGIRDLKLPI